MVKVMGPEVSPELARLADAYGVATEYWDQGGELVKVSAESVAAVLGALGVESSTPEQVADALEEKRLRDWRRPLPPVFVTRAGDWRDCWVHVPHGSSLRIWIDLEDGGSRHDLPHVDTYVAPQQVDGELVGQATYSIPGDLPLGWHTLRVEFDDCRRRMPGGRHAEQPRLERRCTPAGSGA